MDGRDGAAPLEIERKFLVKEGAWTPSGPGVAFAQRYLSDDPDRTVRVRIAGDRAFVTVKGRPAEAGADGIGIVRVECETEVPVAFARQVMALCLPGGVEKVRHVERHAGTVWEVDVFGGDNAGLVLAEVELPSEDATFGRPDWLGEEVSRDPRYLNSNLATSPWRGWGAHARRG